MAWRGIDEEEKGNLQLEFASLSIPVLGSRFNMGLYAGSAAALLRLWDRESEADEWDVFLTHLKIPEKTAELFRERARRIVERSGSLKRVFLF